MLEGRQQRTHNISANGLYIRNQVVVSLRVHEFPVIMQLKSPIDFVSTKPIHYVRASTVHT